MQSMLPDGDVHRRRFAEFHGGRAPRNKGLRYPADPPRVDEIAAVMGAAGDRPSGLRLRGLIVVLWRAGLRIQEALELAEGDLDPRRGALLVRSGKRLDTAGFAWSAPKGTQQSWSLAAARAIGYVRLP